MLKQSLHYKLLQKLSPQQIQLMKLIQLPTQAFEERLKQEIEENPALDTGKEESDSIDDDLSNEFDDDAGNEKIEAEDINIDEYLSDDDDLVFEEEPIRSLVCDQNMVSYSHDGFWQPMDTAREFKYLNKLFDLGRAPWIR